MKTGSGKHFVVSIKDNQEIVEDVGAQRISPDERDRLTLEVQGQEGGVASQFRGLTSHPFIPDIISCAIAKNTSRKSRNGER